MNNKTPSLLLLAGLTLILSACQASKQAVDKATSSVDQTQVCETKEWKQVSDCHAGQKVTFLPNSWGNQQLPILFAAVNCDMRYSVALTEGGVVCIYQPITPKQ